MIYYDLTHTDMPIISVNHVQLTPHANDNGMTPHQECEYVREILENARTLSKWFKTDSVFNHADMAKVRRKGIMVVE